MLKRHWRALLSGAPVLFSLAAQAQQTSATPPSLYTSEQAQRGQASYAESCALCHGQNLDDGGQAGGPPLRGVMFQSQWGGGDVATLFTFIRNGMPANNPAGLSDATYADIVAYILQSNGYTSGDTELPPDLAAQVGLSLAANR